MAHFLGRVVVAQDGKWWILRAPLLYVDEDARYSVEVPSGFVTDFASIPPAFWSVFPPDDPEYSAAAIVHDRLYETQQLPREQADLVLYRAMAVHGTPRWKRAIMWRAVRLFGASAYASGPERQRERLAVHHGQQPSNGT